MDLEHEQRLTTVEERSKSNSHRIETVEKRQDNFDKLVESVATIAVRQGVVEDNVEEIKGDVKSLAEKPAKRWDSIVDKIVWAILASVITFLLARLGL